MERNSTTARASTAADGNRSAGQIGKATSTEQASKPKRPRLPSRKNRHSQIHARPIIVQTYSRLLIKKKQLSELRIARKNAVNSVLHTIAQSHAGEEEHDDLDLMACCELYYDTVRTQPQRNGDESC